MYKRQNQIKASYYVTKADFVACHLASYIEKFDIVQDIKPGGTFLLNCPWNLQELEEHLPAAAKRYLAQNHIRVYTCCLLYTSGIVRPGPKTLCGGTPWSGREDHS